MTMPGTPTAQVRITAVDTVRDVVEAAVRAEHEDAILAEVERRMAAVEAAIAGRPGPLPAPAAPEPPKPRRTRSDKGRPRSAKVMSPEAVDRGLAAFEAAMSDAAAPAQDDGQAAPGGGGGGVDTLPEPPAAPGGKFEEVGLCECGCGGPAFSVKEAAAEPTPAGEAAVIAGGGMEALAADANVRYRYTCDESDAALFDDAEIRRRFSAAHTLKIEREITRATASRAGAAEVAAARSVEDKLRAYGQAAAVEITPALIEKLHTLESEVGNA